MAISATHLTTAGSGTNGTSWATASISPGGNRLVLAAIVNTDQMFGAGTITLSGNGLTWVQVATQSYHAGLDRLTLFRAMGSSPSSGAVTITSSNSDQGCCWSIVEFDGVDTGGTNGSGAIVQSNTNSSTTGTTMSASLSAFADAVNNVAFGAFGAFSSSGVTPGGGFAELGEATAGIDPARVETEWKTGEDTLVDATRGGSNAWAAIAAEIKAAGAGGGAATPKRLALLGVGH